MARSVVLLWDMQPLMARSVVLLWDMQPLMARSVVLLWDMQPLILVEHQMWEAVHQQRELSPSVSPISSKICKKSIETLKYIGIKYM
jgi:hypothetical protein